VLATEELIARFDLEHVSRNPARFDEVKLRWLNGVYIRALAPDELAARVAAFLRDSGHSSAGEDERFARAVAISQEKIHTLADFWPLAGPLLDGLRHDPEARERWLGETGRAKLAEVRDALAGAESFDEAAVGAVLQGIVARRGLKPRDVYQPLRVAISGTTVSPGIFESVALLGREETLRRVDAALAAG
jgi:glutamyl-tRNA synthetase